MLTRVSQEKSLSAAVAVTRARCQPDKSARARAPALPRICLSRITRMFCRREATIGQGAARVSALPCVSTFFSLLLNGYLGYFVPAFPRIPPTFPPSLFFPRDFHASGFPVSLASSVSYVCQISLRTLCTCVSQV